SVLSKKAAAGATHLVIDMPVGPTAKVRTSDDAASLKTSLLNTAEALGIKTRVVESDGRQPVGRGIGPALEAQDVLKVLRRDADAPDDLRRRAVALAGVLLELGGAASSDAGEQAAAAALAEGRAWAKFQAICDAQGGMRAPPRSAYQHPILADHGGIIAAIDNRRLAKAAKLAGAPDAKAAGLELHGFLGQRVDVSEPLFTLHAETQGEMDYALEYLENHPPIFEIEA
ncbi:MAG: thymidine phosphorylase, partial [Oricola sp.]|nr:thymidine phosphorylase [Oricola sp.]